MNYKNKENDTNKENDKNKEKGIFKLTVKSIKYRNELYTFFIKNSVLSLAFIDPETNELCFHAKTVFKLDVLLKKQKYKLTERQVLCLIQSLSFQIKWFESNNLTFLGWNLEDIIVIDNFYFFIATNKFLQPFLGIDAIELFVPYEKPYFSSPEIININKLPASIHCKSCYYSLGLLIVFCFFGEYLLKGNDIPSKESIELVLKPIYLSKLYWFLQRCLQYEPEKRILLYT